MSFDLYLHASEDQTRKIPRAEVDAAISSIDGVSAVSKREYAFEGDGYRVELETELETAAGGDVKGIYVHVADGSGSEAFGKAKELALDLVRALALHIYDHQQGSYVSPEAFAAAPIPEDGVVFRAGSGRPSPAVAPAAASPAPPPAAPAATTPSTSPTPPAPGGGGCAGFLLLGAAGLAAAAAALLS